MRRIAHPNFKDVAWLLVDAKEYKKGYIDVKFYWIYPKNQHRLEDVLIFTTVERRRLTKAKFRELRKYEERLMEAS